MQIKWEAKGHEERSLIFNKECKVDDCQAIPAELPQVASPEFHNGSITLMQERVPVDHYTRDFPTVNYRCEIAAVGDSEGTIHQQTHNASIDITVIGMYAVTRLIGIDYAGRIFT